MRYFNGIKIFKLFFAVLVVVLNTSVAFGDATEQLLRLASSGKVSAKTIERLIEAGANVNARSEGEFYGPEGQTALMLLAGGNMREEDMNIKERLEAVDMLIKYGADVNARDNYGTTALMFSRNPESTKILIKAGANVHAQDKTGSTALINLSMYDEACESIKILIKSGANVNVMDNNGITALMQAAQFNERSDNVKALIKAGANVNIKSVYSTTALMEAVYSTYSSRNTKGPEYSTKLTIQM